MVRVGLSGCGAVSQLYYGPALRLLESEGRLTLAGLFDPDEAAVEKLKALSPEARSCASLEALLALDLDLLIVASPPKFHAGQTIAALEAGIAVHCEKPLAISSEDGARMLAAARSADRRLSVGLMRRAFPAVRAIGGMLQQEITGPLRSVDGFEGGRFNWPVASPRYFSREESGGGVLRDIGPHALDLLTGWLGEPQVQAYRDDAQGGVEANCLIELSCGGVPCRLRMSRDWARPNRYLFVGAKGWISWTPYEAERLQFGVNDGPAGTLDLRKPLPGQPHVLGGREVDFHGAFAGGLRDVVAQVRGGAAGVDRRTLALDTLELIDRCYEMRRPMEEPWLSSQADAVEWAS